MSIIAKQPNKDNLTVQIFDTDEQMGATGAAIVTGKIRELLQTQPIVNIIFAAAPSQNAFLAGLIKEDIEWDRINAFHMDEYIGLADNSPQAFGIFLKERLFDKVPFLTVNYLNGNAADKVKECERYEQLLKAYPTDIVCMGIGENGHIAFNDPPVADFNDPKVVKVVELDDMCRQQQVNDDCFDSFTDVPESALTLTIPTLMKAKYIYCFVPGTRKAEAVKNTLQQDIIEEYPSTILRRHPNAILFLDRASSALI
ncbi:MAG: glucosamine-6-phosphate deaminase [Bacteroidota bacterium]